MIVARSLIRQTLSLRSATQTFSKRCLLVTGCPKLQQLSQGQHASLALQLCIPHSSQMRHMSTTESCKFEVMNVQDEEDFKKRVLECSLPVVVDFHATWCGPCKILGPRLEKLVSEADGKVLMAKVDVDDNSDLAMEYEVRSIPTVLGFKDGKVLNQFVGLLDEDQIQAFVDKLTVC